MKSPNTIIVFETTHEDLPPGSLFASFSPKIADGILHALFLDTLVHIATVSDARVTAFGRKLLPPTHPVLLVHAAEMRIQSDGRCGERLRDAFSDIFDEGSRSVLAIIARIPCIPQRMLGEAFSLLDTFEDAIVVGTANDGSLGAIGLRHYARDAGDAFAALETFDTDQLMHAMPSCLTQILPLAAQHDPSDLDELIRLLGVCDEGNGDGWTRTRAFLRSNGVDIPERPVTDAVLEPGAHAGELSMDVPAVAVTGDADPERQPPDPGK